MTSSDSFGTRTPALVCYLHPEMELADRVANALDARIDGVAVRAIDSVSGLRTLVEDGDVDCLVTAYELNQTDGVSMTEELRRDRHELPIVLSTPAGSEQVASAAVAAGVSGYVPIESTPPEAVDELVAAIEDVLERTQTKSTLRRRWKTVESLHDVALEFESCTSPEETYQFAAEAMSQVLDVAACVIYVAEADELVPKATVGELPGGFRPFGLDEGIVGRTYQTGVSSYTNEIPSEEGASPVGPQLQSGISVPVGSVGVMQAVSTTPNAHDEHARKLGELLAAHVSAAVSRIRSEQAMRAERDQLASLFDNVPDAVVITVGEDQRVRQANPAFEETFGYGHDEVVDEPVNEFLVPAEEDPIRIADSVGTGEVVTGEITRQTTEGTREFLFRGFAAEGEDDVREYGIYTDITERIERERELEQYRTLVETVGDPMYVLDPEGSLEMVNTALADTMGLPQREVHGRHVSEFMRPEDFERGTRLVTELASDEKRRWETYEMVATPAEGPDVEVEASVAPLVDDGTISGSVGVIRDISERKDRERRIRELHDGTRRLMAAEGATEVAVVASEIADDALDLSINGIYLHDAASNTLEPVATTDCTAELLGDVPTIEADDGLIWDAYAIGEPLAYGDVTQAENVYNPETPIRSEAHIPLGDHGVFVVGSTEVNDFDEEALALAKILASNLEAALDRADRENTLADRTRELERQNDRLDEFAGMVSHDLRNPLTLAAGHLEGARERADPAVDDHLSDVSWALDRMEELIADVLELARSGRELTETSTVDLAAVVDQAHRTVDPDLDVVVDDELGHVQAGRQRLLALFENCLQNAVEHAGDDVTVTVSATEDGFAIADDGPGIPVDERETVLETGYTTAEDGTGFGLAIVTDVVEVHGWSLTVDKSEAGGARFVIRTDE